MIIYAIKAFRPKWMGFRISHLHMEFKGPKIRCHAVYILGIITVAWNTKRSK